MTATTRSPAKLTPCDSSATPDTAFSLPAIDVRQVLLMTDDTGMFQHAVYATPDPRHGYCIDDNARALIAALAHARLKGPEGTPLPMGRYLMFLAYAFNNDRRVFRNFMGYDRQWLEDEGSQDSQGRTIWALGLAVRDGPDAHMRDLAWDLIDRALPGLERIDSLRAWAFVVLGLSYVLEVKPEATRVRAMRDTFADRLMEFRERHAREDWPWWESVVTYDNAKLCHALVVAGRARDRPEMIDAGLTSLRWLLGVQTEDDSQGEPYLSIIGNHGWLREGHERARFDQQPLEAYAMVDGLLAAATVSDDPQWRQDAWRCFEWFTGRNDLGQSMVNPETGACQDGLEDGGVNKNQGAESVLAYLLSLLELAQAQACAGSALPDELPLDEQASQDIPAAQAQATVGLGIVGASGFAAFCLEQYRQVEGVAPRVVWSRTEVAAEAFAARTGLARAGSLAALLKDASVDLVHIAGTPDTHASQAMSALRAGKHVILEKPIALSSVDAQRLRAEAAARGRVLAVNHMMPHGPLTAPMTALIESGVLGAVLRGVVTNRAGDAGLGPDHWFWDPAKSGGIFIEHGVHFFDLICRWLGPGRVLSAYRLKRPGQAVIDQCGCDVQHGLQCVVSHYHGFTQSPHTDRQEVSLVFERGRVTLTGWVQHRLELEAAVDDAGFAAIETMLPEAALVHERVLAQGDQIVRRRGRDERVTRVASWRWDAVEDTSAARQALYGRALTALLQNARAAMRDPRQRLVVSPDDAIAALVLAEDATRMAGELTDLP